MDPKGFHRKLSAILSADVAGYSRLMQDDEAATVQTPKIISESLPPPVGKQITTGGRHGS